VAVHGHAAILASLERDLPAVSLFLGPFSVGRWTVAEHARWRYGIEGDDVLRVHDLTVDSARTIKEFTLTRPAISRFKLVIVDLHKATAVAQSMLRSSLVMPLNARIIVIAQPYEVWEYLKEHAVTYQFRYLAPKDISAVLVERMNFSPDRADDLALRAGGQVYGALKLADADDSIERVRKVIHALRTHDQDELNESAGRWTDEDTAWLAQWCNESLSGQWRVFEASEAADSKSLPLRILIATKPRVRPRLVVRSQLMSILKGN
jgi:hypothetical protein